MLVVCSLLLTVQDISSNSSLTAPKWIGIGEGEGSATLRWFRVQGATGYIVQRKVGEEGDFSDFSKVSNPQFADFNIVPNKAYFYRIIPFDRNGDRGQVSEIRFIKLKALDLLQTSPPDWVAHQKRPNGIALSWKHPNPNQVLAYNLYRKRKGDTNFTLIHSAVDTTHYDKDVYLGSNYLYVVSALDRQLRESGYSDILTIDYQMEIDGSGRDNPLTRIKTLEEVVSRTELVTEFSMEKHGFVSPVDIEYDAKTERIFVSDSGTGLITAIGSDNRVVFRVGGSGANQWDFERLLGFAVDDAGYIYAADAYRGEIVVFSPRGVFQRVIKLEEKVRDYFGEELFKKYPWFRFGIVDVEILSDGSLVVVDNPNGWFYILNTEDRLIRVVGEKGFAESNMHNPTFAVVNQDGTVIVSDTLNSRLQVYRLNGSHVGSFGGRGLGIGQFLRPKGVALGSYGEIYVADSQQNVIQVFDSDREFLSLLGDDRGLPIDLGSPNGLVFVEPDLLMVVERLSSRVKVLRLLEIMNQGATETQAYEELVKPDISVKKTSVDLILENLQQLKEIDGTVTIDEPLFEVGTPILTEKGSRIFIELSNSVRNSSKRYSIKVSAVVGDSISPLLARNRLQVINNFIGTNSNVHYLSVTALSGSGARDRIEISSEKLP
jgi:DNA-binding beta-propeller fold protein YncE